LGMRVEVGVNSLSHHSFGNGSSDHCWCRGVGQRGGRCENAGVGGGDQSGECDELKKKKSDFNMCVHVHACVRARARVCVCVYACVSTMV